MSLPVDFDFPPMEAESAREIPSGPEWQYEPKWDGFRCIAFRDGDTVAIRSKSGQTLERYFPEVAAALADVGPQQFVLDGELVVPLNGALSFDSLLQRIHPADSRIRKLARETPAQLIVFDLLVDESGAPWYQQPLRERRPALDRFAAAHLAGNPTLHLSPFTRNLDEAKRWFTDMAGDLDGVIAKRTDVPYNSGHRDAMWKIKNLRTADCVIGGFRYGQKTRVVGSLLLGLYDEQGLLHHVGFTSGLAAAEKRDLTAKLEALIKPPGFTGSAPGGPSRWSTERSAEWQPLDPKLVIEVQYDHYAGGRFRHGTKLLRWRPDKSPAQCTMAQVSRDSQSPLDLLS